MFDKAEWLHDKDWYKILIFQFSVIIGGSVFLSIVSNIWLGIVSFIVFTVCVLLDAQFPGIFD
jgi:hypothetical protein